MPSGNKPLRKPMLTHICRHSGHEKKEVSIHNVAHTQAVLSVLVSKSKKSMHGNFHTIHILFTELILGLRPANKRRRYLVATSHWHGANLESALYWQMNEMKILYILFTICHKAIYIVIIIWGLFQYKDILPVYRATNRWKLTSVTICYNFKIFSNISQNFSIFTR